MINAEHDKTLTSWRRVFRRTNVHIAEYILMLVLMGSLAGVLASTFYSFFGLLQVDGFAARTLALVVLAQLGSLVVLTPAAFWFYSRVSGQEMVHPELMQKTSRTVFLTIWLIGMFLSLVGVSISIAAGVIGAVVGGGSDGGSVILSVVLPGILTVGLLSFFVITVAHRSTRALTKIAGIVIAAVAVVMLIANLILAIVNIDRVDSDDSDEKCTYSRYVDRECSYSEYRSDRNSSYDYNQRSSSGGFENIYQPSFRF